MIVGGHRAGYSILYLKSSLEAAADVPEQLLHLETSGRGQVAFGHVFLVSRDALGQQCIAVREWLRTSDRTEEMFIS
ncbi:hypothetical protein chiPu_0000350 [Chiloscyllium punctatum]|uniref:Uncharacterized protein n=1 Tax=Chiloscyllium punctatum TaxID=137246 RepID=A0A401RUZ9_CHIPU|nr:hypothetical protein [Chiloscyllium punctatum]